MGLCGADACAGAERSLGNVTIVVPADEMGSRRRLLEELDRVTKELRAMPAVHEVWLFGSLHDGRVTTTSDIDLLVVMDSAEQPVDRALSPRRRLQPRTALDLFVWTPAEIAAGGRFADDARRRGGRLA